MEQLELEKVYSAKLVELGSITEKPVGGGGRRYWLKSAAIA
jgi:hypothetical protein